MTTRSSDRGTLAAIGSYTPDTGGRGQGITLARLSPDRIDLLGTVEAPSPSFLAWAPGGQVLYAAHETAVGTLGAYRLHTDHLESLGEVSSEGGRPCHVAVHPSGRFVACANYAGGTYATRVVDTDGALGRLTGVIRHRGSGPHPTRQTVAHPHTVHFTADGHRAFLTDISLDTISVHRVDAARCCLEPEPVQVVQLPKGSGPRHVSQLPGGALVVVHEIDASMSTIRIADSELTIRATGHPTSRSGGSGASPSEIAAWGHHRVVVGNRNTSTLAIHRTEPATGELAIERDIPIRPANIRHFAIADDCAYLALQDGDLVVAVDLVTGCETASGRTLSPACISLQPTTALQT